MKKKVNTQAADLATNPEPMDEQTSILTKKVEELELQLVNEKEAKLRAMADFQNYKKRIEQERYESSSLANKELLLHTMELVDDFNRTLNHQASLEQKNYDELLNGSRMVFDKLIQLLTSQGLKKIEIKPGDQFDPHTMEAISTVPVNEAKEDKTIVHVDQFGYLDQNKNSVYRTAKVIIGKFTQK